MKNINLSKKFFKPNDKETFCESYLPLAFFWHQILVRCPYCGNQAKVTTDIPPVAEQEPINEIFIDGGALLYNKPEYGSFSLIKFLCLTCSKSINADLHSFYQEAFIKKYWFGKVRGYAKLIVCPKCHSRQKLSKNILLDTIPHMTTYHTFVCLNCQALSEVAYSFERACLYSDICDPFFSMQLWLVENIKHQSLWFYNMEHLEIIRLYITAKKQKKDFIIDSASRLDKLSLADRPMSFSANLPSWLKNRKNKVSILAAIERLKIRATK